jgi:dTMP kinase
MNPIINRGKLIILEGLDRSGKSSVTKFIKEYLLDKNLEAVQMNFPDRNTIIGKMIDGYLSNKADINN